MPAGLTPEGSGFLWGIWSTRLYPQDEPTLRAQQFVPLDDPAALQVMDLVHSPRRKSGPELACARHFDFNAAAGDKGCLTSFDCKCRQGAIPLKGTTTRHTLILNAYPLRHPRAFFEDDSYPFHFFTSVCLEPETWRECIRRSIDLQQSVLKYYAMEKLDFVAIGDITTDAFIKLQNARVNCDINDENCQLCVDFGAKIPYESVTEVRSVGNSPNAAVSANRLGLNSAIVTNLGDDDNGKKMLARLQEEGVTTEFVKVEAGKESNYHYVLLYEHERTILIKHHEYEYRLPDFEVPPQWLYFSSVGENSLSYHHEIAAYVKAHPETKLAFQPGTFQIKLGADILKDVYEATELFFCNKKEAQSILRTDSSDMKELLDSIRALGPKIAIITDGPRGAFASDGTEAWMMPMYPDPAPPVDRTGAGDSFSSTVTAMLALGMTLPEALARGPINSMSVVQYIGAQEGLLSREKIEELLTQAPTDYKISTIK